jgi:lipid-A-disaccharide synthase
MIAADIVILSNGPGELMTWVRPVVQALRQQLGSDRALLRISLVLSPCPNASSKEEAIARSFPEIDRIQAAQHFFPFLLWGKTAESWEWRDRGVVVFLGGDQIYPILIGKRLGYRTVIYGEWETRWHRWGDRYGVMNQDVASHVPARYAHKVSVVGDLMADVGTELGVENTDVERASSNTSFSSAFCLPPSAFLIGLLPGSKPAKLAQGVPLTLAIAQRIQQTFPEAQFVIPVAPTLDVQTLARFANPQLNRAARFFDAVAADLVDDGEQHYLKTADGLKVYLWTGFPAYEVLAQCRLCLTTVGANTAELGALAVPMLVLLPTQQLDAMKAWDGIPGLLANLPGVGHVFASLINAWFLRKSRLLAWPNIWAGEEIVPELVGHLTAQEVADVALDLLHHPDQLDAMGDRLRSVRGKSGAAHRLTQMVAEELYRF